MKTEYLMKQYIDITNQIKALEVRKKQLSEHILSSGTKFPVTVDKTTFTTQTRATYEVPDMQSLVRWVGLPTFCEMVSVSKTKADKQLGKSGVDELLEAGILGVKRSPEYLVLRSKK